MLLQLGELLAELRQDRNLTQREISELLHVSVGTISNYEKGAHYPDVEKLVVLANFFDVSTDFLLGRVKNRISPAVLQCEISGTKKTVGEFLEDFQQLEDSQKHALMVVLSDMNFSTMIKTHQKRGNL